MKRAVSYIRISNKDQSNFSLDAQRDFIKAFCERKGIHLSNCFIDNGQSAKNFDRADWKRLESFVKENYKSLDYIVVVKYDRFSRNVSEGLNMMDKLERKYDVKILSVFEEISIDPASPFFFKMRTDMLVQAEFELRVIRDRTKFGVDQAKKQGRWINRAPLGYVNKRDGNNKPIIVVDAEQSLRVKRIFSLFLSGAGPKTIAKEVNVKGHSRVQNILKNPVYAGFLRFDTQIIKGIHEPIISLSEYQQALTKLSPGITKVIERDEVPLRGVIRCHCGHLLTAGESRGKTKTYWYYKCPEHLNVNISASKIHERVTEMLREMSYAPAQVEYMAKKTEQELKAWMREREQSAPGMRKKLQEVENKLESMESKFLSDQIKFDVYAKWRDAFTQERQSLQFELNQATRVEECIWTKYRDHIHNLTALHKVYGRMTTTEKRHMINTVFNYDLRYQLNTFKTSIVIPELTLNASSLKEKGLLEISELSPELSKNPFRTRKGSIVELLELFKSAA